MADTIFPVYKLKNAHCWLFGLQLRRGVVDLVTVQTFENKRFFCTRYTEELYWGHMSH
jgi:hypothetical protein